MLGGGLIINGIKANGGGIIILPDPISEISEHQAKQDASISIGLVILFALVASIAWFKFKNKR